MSSKSPEVLGANLNDTLVTIPKKDFSFENITGKNVGIIDSDPAVYWTIYFFNYI